MGEITRSYITMFVTDAQKTAITDMFRENKWLCLLHVLSDANVAEVFAKGLGKIFPSDDSVFDDPSMSDFIADFKIEVNDIASDSDVEENADFHESDTESSSETTRENEDELTLSSDRHMFKIQAPDSIEIQAPKIKIEPPDSIEIEAPSNIKMEAPDSIEIEAPNSMEMKVDSQSRGSHIDHDDAISKRTNPVSFQNNSNLNSNNQVLSYSQIQQQQLDTSINGQNLRASSVNEVNKATSPGIQGIPLLFSVNGKPYIATVNGKLAVFSTGIKPSVPDVHGQQNNSGGPVSVVKRQDNAMISLLNVTSQQNISQKHVPVVEKQQDNTMIPLFNVTSHQNNFQKHVPVVEKQQDNTMIPLFNVTSQQNNFQKNQGNVSIPVSTVIAQQFPTSVSLPDAKAQQNNSGVPVSGANEQKNNTWIFPVCAPKSQQSNGVANVKTQQNGLQIVMAHQNKKYYVESHQNSSNTHVQNVKKPPINAGTPMNNVMAVQNKADIPVKNVKGQHTNGNIPLQIGNSIPLLEDLLEQKGIAWKDKRKKAKQTSKSAQSLTTFKLHNTDTELPSQNVMRTCKGIYVCNANAPKTDTERPVPNIKEQHIDAELSLQTVKGQPTTTGLPISNEDAQQINAGIPVPEVKLEQTEAGIPLGNINRQQTDSSVLVPDEREQQNNASNIQVLEMKRQHTGQLNLKDDGISASIVEGQQIHEGGNGAVKKGADRPLILQRANRHYIRKRANRPIILEESCVETSLTPPEPNLNVDVGSELKVMEPKKRKVKEPKKQKVQERKKQKVIERKKKNVTEQEKVLTEDIKQKQGDMERKQEDMKQPITLSRQDKGVPVKDEASFSNTPETVKEIPASKKRSALIIVDIKKGKEDQQQQLVKNSFMCDDCQTFYKTERTLIDHMKRSHKASLPDLRRCGRKFTSDSGLWKYREEKKHAKLKSSKKFLCELCGGFFLSKFLLEKHCEQKCQPEPPKPLVKCADCKITFKQKSNLLKHVQYLHHTIKCPTCRKDFRGLKGLYFHWKTANNGICFKAKKFICEYCGKGFDRHMFLATHLRIHTRKKPHICPICGHASRLKAYLRKHVLLIHKLSWKQIRDPSRVFRLAVNI